MITNQKNRFEHLDKLIAGVSTEELNAVKNKYKDSNFKGVTFKEYLNLINEEDECYFDNESGIYVHGEENLYSDLNDIICKTTFIDTNVLYCGGTVTPYSWDEDNEMIFNPPPPYSKNKYKKDSRKFSQSLFFCL